MAKNIVLLADGTGNSAASAFKTNVWRLYQALDMGADVSDMPQQIVRYTQGIGTKTYSPFSIVERITGLGVWQQVFDLYLFACRNYEDGDRLYCFGFSRRAFATGLLIDLISRFGIVKTAVPSETSLIDAVYTIFGAHRRELLIRASRQRHMLYHHILPTPRFINDKSGQAIVLLPATGRQQFVDVHFVGLWDAIAAYGLPLEILNSAVDDWVWPLSIASSNLPSRVVTGRHALSIDDARPAFRPLLWNEGADDAQRVAERPALRSGRIEQVWFAGSHANVGGGYPDDNLAYVSLNWMMDEAAKTGLRFVKWDRQEIRRRADPHGVYYDSRSGFAAGYRYWPRNIRALCNDEERQVFVPTIRVHSSVFERIAVHRVAYEPISLNCAFQVVDKIVPQSATTKIFAPDQKALEIAWDYVWWRAVGYYASLILVTFLSLFVLRLVVAWPDDILKQTEGAFRSCWLSIVIILGSTTTTAIANGFAWIVDRAHIVAPDWGPLNTPLIGDYPLSGTVALITLMVVHMLWIPKLRLRSAQYAEYAWAAQKGIDIRKLVLPVTMLTWLPRALKTLRPFTEFVYRRMWRGVLVALLGSMLGIFCVIALSPYWIPGTLRRRPWMAGVKAG